jgi:DNA mismatch endonuclease, patch repair protein
MEVTRRRDTPAELALRAELRRLGLRYRVDASPVSGSRRRADVVIFSARLAVFVDGCFWHGCPLHGTWPKKHARWWREKIETNCRRDADTDRHLALQGWAVVRAWAHEDMRAVAWKVVRLVARAGASTGGRRARSPSSTAPSTMPRFLGLKARATADASPRPRGGRRGEGPGAERAAGRNSRGV